MRNPGITIEVLPSIGSSGGIKAVVAQVIDLGLASRPLKEAEAATGARSEGFARTQMAFASSSRTEVESLTPDEVASILSGQTTHWPSGEPIRLVMRPPSESAIGLLRSLSPELDRAVDAALARPGLVTAITDQDNADTLEELAGSFGLVAIGQIRAERRRLQPIPFENPARADTSADDTGGALSKTLYLVSIDASSPEARAFRDFVFSADARAILSAHDFDPIQ